MALPIWALYMQKCYADPELNISKEKFEEPENLRIELDCDKFKNQQEGQEGDPEEEEEVDFNQ